MKTAKIMTSLVLWVLAGATSQAPAQDPATSSAGRLLAALLQATEEANADRARTGPRFLDMNRTSTLLSTALGGSIPDTDLLAALPAGYRHSVAESVKRCSSRGGPPCRIIEDDGVLVTLDSLQVIPRGVRAVVTWRDNAPNPLWGLDLIEWVIVLERSGDDWVPASRQARRMS